MEWKKQRSFEADEQLFGLGRATPELCRAAWDRAGEKGSFYSPQNTVDLGCVEPFSLLFFCTCLAWGGQCCCIAGAGLTSPQMGLSFGKVRWGLGVKHSGFTPRGAAPDKQLLDPALDTEQFRLVPLGRCARVREVTLPSVLLFISRR